MTMDKGEIVREYKYAKNQRKMISILADLNCCSKDEIREILGLKVNQKRKQRSKAKLIDEEIKSLYERLDELDKQIIPLEDEYRRTVHILMTVKTE